MRRTLLAATVALVSAFGLACNPAALLALFNCSFRVESTADFTVAGVQLDDLESLTFEQMAQVVAYWANGDCPVDFTLNIGIRNPNTGSGDTLETTATMVSFAWDLYLDTDSGDDFDTTWVVSGETLENLEVPGTGETVILPLGVSFDAFTILEGVLDVPELVTLMLAIGGVDSGQRDDEHLGRLIVHAEPSFETPIGDIEYPGGLWVGLDWED
jgi:hypothetical protein